MSVNIEKQMSRLRHAILHSIDGIEFWGRPKLPAFPVSPKDTEYTVVEGDRIDTLAKRFFKNEKRWWVIAYANNMGLLPNELRVGMKIRIPDPALVRRVLLV